MLNWATGLDGVTFDVQLGLGSAPGTAQASISWTSIGTYVRAATWIYGRSTELDSYQGGRLTATLDNRDRRFDPLHSAGPYFGNLKPMVPIRLRLTYSATTVTAWTGYVSGFPQAYEPPREATSTITATDAFTVLTRTRLRSEWAYEVLADSPYLWWRLGEQAGTTAVDSSGNGRDGTYIGGGTFNSATGLIVDPDNAVAFQTTQYTQAMVTWPAFPFSVELWFTAPTPGVQTSNYLVYALAGSNWFILQSIYSPGGAPRYLLAYVNQSGSNFTAQTVAGSIYADGLPHHVVVTYPSNNANPFIYVDGVDRTSTSSHTGPASNLGSLLLNAPYQGVAGAAYPDPVAFAPTLDEFVLYPSALSSARVLAHYNAGHTPWQTLDTGAAIWHVLDRIGWPTADRNIETGATTVQSFDSTGRTALDLIQDLERSEQGRFFISPSGVATFYNRDHVYRTAASTTSQATFGDGAGELFYGDLGTEYDDSTIRNSITTQGANGSPFLAEDATSITNYLHREFSISGLLNDDDGEIRDIGLWQLARYKDPATRVPSIVLSPRRSPATLFAQVRDRALVDRVTIKRRPQNVGSAISLDVLIEGIQHEVTPGAWRTTYTLSPVDTQGVFILDDNVLGLLDNNRLGF